MELPKVFEGKTLLEPREIPTPFGRAEFGGIEIPPLKMPTLEERHKKAFMHTLGIEGTRLIALIPWIGGVLADNIVAMHSKEIKKLLTSEEFDNYMKWDRVYPDAIALLRSRLHD
jgi:hypothetical protein